MLNRNKDLSEVFDEKWNANHNSDIENAKNNEREFINKMFNVKDNSSNINTKRVNNSVNNRVERLNQNIASTVSNNRYNNARNIMNKYK